MNEGKKGGRREGKGRKAESWGGKKVKIFAYQRKCKKQCHIK